MRIVILADPLDNQQTGIMSKATETIMRASWEHPRLIIGEYSKTSHAALTPAPAITESRKATTSGKPSIEEKKKSR